MKGKALVAIKIPRPRNTHSYKQNPLGVVKGRSEDLRSVSPRDRKLENQIYLKSISPNLPLIHRPEINIDTTQSYLNTTPSDLKVYPSKKSRENLANPVKEPVKFENPTLEPSTKFTQHCFNVEISKLDELDFQLFPTELHERFEFVPDDRPTRLISGPVKNQILYENPKPRRKRSKVNKTHLSYMLDSFSTRDTINFENIAENKYTPFGRSEESEYKMQSSFKRKSASLIVDLQERRDKIRFMARNLLAQL